MTLIGLGGMAIIMVLLMKDMYKNKMKNTMIVIGSLLMMTLATLLVRTQVPIDDVKWMKAMIPHHSIAILTSGRADIKDPEVKKLADDIIET